MENPWYVDKTLEAILSHQFNTMGFFCSVMSLLCAKITMAEMHK